MIESISGQSFIQSTSFCSETESISHIPTVRSKFVFVGNSKFYIRGVSYGAFEPDPDGFEYCNKSQIESDFAQMVTLGINTVRIPHTVPPRSLLDTAQRHGLRVIVGLSAEQYVGHLMDGKLPKNFAGEFRSRLTQCMDHPALLCVAIGNEIPAAQVRWLGRRRVEAYLRRLYFLVKECAPRILVTYVNYPSTEYLDLPFLDIVSFNIYLERRQDLEAYLVRLQNLAGERPLLITELGLDSLRNGEMHQAEVLDWQIRTVFASGAAGAVIFSWTDEWYRGGGVVEDWSFGITDRARHPKPAAMATRNAFAEIPFQHSRGWPHVSVVVCTFNGAATIRRCLEHLIALDYPSYEIIVVDDGSADGTGEIAAQFNCRLITQSNKGLSEARNVGLAASCGEVIAYIDDDAYPDCDWLRFLAAAFDRSNHAAIGGPNILPPQSGAIAAAVAGAPGGPIHVLLTDEIAEHIPGCNMAFCREELVKIGGFDPRFRSAGDDVDVCWRLQKAGHTIGFCAAAVVYHYRRNSIPAFWRQQSGYGKAEALLAAKWPEKYNKLGHISWVGRIYSCEPILPRLFGQRVYHGVGGSAPFQSVHNRRPNAFLTLVSTPEWPLIVAILAAVSVFGLALPPLLISAPIFVLASAFPIAEAMLRANRALSARRRKHVSALWWLTFLTTILQPIARLHGRLRYGLVPWRSRLAFGLVKPWRMQFALWSDRWHAPEEWLRQIKSLLLKSGAYVVDGGPYSPWDIEIPAGLLGSARLVLAIEDHGSGTQYVRAKVWPCGSKIGLGIVAGLIVLGLISAGTAVRSAAIVCIVMSLLILGRLLYEAAAASGTVRHVLGSLPCESDEYSSVARLAAD